VAETTALGAAYAAGLAVGFWRSTNDLLSQWAEDKRWQPAIDSAVRADEYEHWKRAVERTLGWTRPRVS
jgi:glycerol kinase